jgi:nucleotide-binding universal stress UspA family protein
VLHAQELESPAYFTSEQVEELSAESERSKNLMQEELDDFVKRNVDLVSGDETVVVDSLPVTAVLDTADKIGADLIVMGSNGRSGIDRLLLGSVFEGVLREASCPVLAVNPQTTLPETQSVSIKRILSPVNRTESARRALEYSTKLAHSLSADVLVLEVVEDEERGNESDELNTLCDWISSESRSLCKIKEIIGRGDVVEQIISVANDEKADLIVLGVQHKLFQDKAAIGARVAHVVRNAHCPVLCVSAKAVHNGSIQN